MMGKLIGISACNININESKCGVHTSRVYYTSKWIDGSRRAPPANSIGWNRADTAHEFDHWYLTIAQTVIIKTWRKKYLRRISKWLAYHNCLGQLQFLYNIGDNSTGHCTRTIPKTIFSKEIPLHLNWRVLMGSYHFGTTNNDQWKLVTQYPSYIRFQRLPATKPTKITQGNWLR